MQASRRWGRRQGWTQLLWAVLGQSSLGTGTPRHGGLGCSSAGVRDALAPGSVTFQFWDAPALGSGMLRHQGQGCSGTGVSDVPVLGSGMLRHWVQGCSGTGVRDALALGSGMLQLWSPGCSGPGIRDALVLGSGMLWHWGQGCSCFGVRDALCDGDPKSGHRARAGDAGHQPAPSTSAAGLDPQPIPPRLTWDQPQGHGAPRDRRLVPPGAGHPPAAGKGRGRASPAAPSHEHTSTSPPSPGSKLVSQQPANQRQLPRITVNGSLLWRPVLNR